MRVAPALAALVVCAAGACSSSCVINKRALKVPTTDKAAVMVVSGAMPQPITEIARHSWFAVKPAGADRWRRIEVGSRSSKPLADYGGGDVRIHGIWTGKKAEKAIACLAKHAPKWISDLDYLPWPGPNSNTFVDVMLRKCNLHADLPATAIGKDYRGLLGASWDVRRNRFPDRKPDRRAEARTDRRRRGTRIRVVRRHRPVATGDHHPARQRPHRLRRPLVARRTEHIRCSSGTYRSEWDGVDGTGNRAVEGGTVCAR